MTHRKRVTDEMGGWRHCRDSREAPDGGAAPRSHSALIDHSLRKIRRRYSIHTGTKQSAATLIE
jgi:hypothetical protein